MEKQTFEYFDDGSESGKENLVSNVVRQPKTTQNQFDMIVQFMERNNEELLDKETFGQLWDNLAADLNDAGPPEHTVVEWKKIWSSHKSYKNRKRTSNMPTHTMTSDRPAKKNCPDRSVEESAVEEVFETVGDANKQGGIQSQFLNKLDIIIDNQKVMISTLTDIAEIVKNAINEFTKKD